MTQAQAELNATNVNQLFQDISVSNFVTHIAMKSYDGGYNEYWDNFNLPTSLVSSFNSADCCVKHAFAKVAKNTTVTGDADYLTNFNSNASQNPELNSYLNPS